MPSVTNFHIAPEQEELFFKSCTFRTSFYGDKIDKKAIEYRKRNFVNLRLQSSFPDVATAWNYLTEREQGLWDDAGYWSDMSGWDLFSQEMIYRLANDIQGLPEPNIFHQYFVGKIAIVAPATEIEIKQTVDFGDNNDPTMYFNYYASLEEEGLDPYAMISVLCHMQYDDVDEWFSYDYYMTNYSSWEYMGGIVDAYGADITETYIILKIHDMRGSVYIDGLSFIAGDVNLINDWQCDNIQANWDSVIVPAGATFLSLYWRNAFFLNP